jgi:hypothetical protein
MPSLPELQTAFARAVIERDERALTGWIRAGHGLDAEARINVYRTNVLGNYRSALREVYPVVLALVGAAFFSRAANDYVLRHASRSGDLNDFGGEFGDFLAGWGPAVLLAYLPDVARLEWAIERVFHAADAPTLDLRALAAVPEATLPALRFKLHPASRMVRSVYPVLRIWQVNQPGFSGDQVVHLDAGADDLLVIRRGTAVDIERLSPGELALIESLAADLPLAQAHARAEEAEPGLDLAALLQRHVLGGTLIAFRVQDGERA